MSSAKGHLNRWSDRTVGRFRPSSPVSRYHLGQPVNIHFEQLHLQGTLHAPTLAVLEGHLMGVSFVPNRPDDVLGAEDPTFPQGQSTRISGKRRRASPRVQMVRVIRSGPNA